MSDHEIIEQLRLRLNNEGREWGLTYEVSEQTYPDGDWTHFYVTTNETRKNSAASRQILANIESDIYDETGREILVIMTRRPEVEEA